MIGIVVTSIVVPLVASATMIVMRSLVSPTPDWGALAEDFSWDLCVLGLGVTGGIVANPQVQAVVGSTGSVAVTAISALVDVGFGGIILNLRRSQLERKLVRRICLMLGAFAVGVPTALAFWK